MPSWKPNHLIFQIVILSLTDFPLFISLWLLPQTWPTKMKFTTHLLVVSSDVFHYSAANLLAYLALVFLPVQERSMHLFPWTLFILYTLIHKFHPYSIKFNFISAYGSLTIAGLFPFFKECIRTFLRESGDGDDLVLVVQDPFHRLLLHGVCEVCLSIPFSQCDFNVKILFQIGFSTYLYCLKQICYIGWKRVFWSLIRYWIC